MPNTQEDKTMTEEKFDAMMKNYQGIGVETENG